eukprot:scaffold247887_cov31-Tisochrysis_lutea.AAC.1
MSPAARRSLPRPFPPHSLSIRLPPCGITPCALYLGLRGSDHGVHLPLAAGTHPHPPPVPVPLGGLFPTCCIRDAVLVSLFRRHSARSGALVQASFSTRSTASATSY